MAEEKTEVSKDVQENKPKSTPEPVKVPGKLSEKATRGTLDKR